MRIYELTLPQIEYYRTFCNFDDKESALFELRRQHIPLQQCAEAMHYDDIKNLSRRVNKKIAKVSGAQQMNDWIENIYWKKIMQNQ